MSVQDSIGWNPDLMEATHTTWIERKRANPDKHFVVSGFCTPNYTRKLEMEGLPVYEEVTRAIAVPAGFARCLRKRRPHPAVPAPAELSTGPPNELAALNAVAAADLVTNIANTIPQHLPRYTNSSHGTWILR